MVFTEEDVFMDPEACYLALIAAVKADDGDAMDEHGEALAAWLDKGGYTPLAAMKDGYERWRLSAWCRDMARAGRMR